MVLWNLGFLFGIVWTVRLSHLFSLKLAYCLLIIASFFTSFLLLRVTSNRCIIFLTAFSLGFAWALIKAQHRMYCQLPRIIEGKTLISRGYIATLPEINKYNIQFDFIITSINRKIIEFHCPLRARIHLYLHKAMGKVPNFFHKGDFWQFPVRLHQPHSFYAPGSFDYETVLFQKGIQAIGYIVENIPFYRIHRTPYTSYFIDILRQKLNYNEREILKKYPLKGLISALTTGVRYEITAKQWKIIRGTGTNHLFAISGLHLTFISGFIYWIIHFFWCRIPSAVLWIPAHQVSIVCTIGISIFYSALSGFALPTQRALLMLCIGSLAALWRPQINVWYSLNLAMFLMLMIEPFAVLSPSFWLSFTAVALIFYATYGRIGVPKNWWLSCRIQFTVSVGLIPLTLLFFKQVSWLSFLCNLIAIPWIGFIVLPLSLLGSLMTLLNTLIGKVILISAERLLELLWQVMSWFSEVMWAQCYIFSSPYLVLSSLLGILILLAAKGVPARWLGFFWISPLLFFKPQGPKYGDIWFYLLDVGQGLASVVRTQHHILVYDTGPRWNSSFDTGKLVVLPFLREIGTRKIDMLMVSHGDNDNSGGSRVILEQLPVSIILSSIPKIFLPREAYFCREDSKWSWDGVRFEIFYPPKNQPYLGNDSSCVLKISNSIHSILLVGDIEKIGENYLLTRNKYVRSTILVVPHHGSKTSSSIDFLNQVQPKYALFSRGYRNRFGFPHSIVLKRYNRLHSRIYDTAVDGTIILKLSASPDMVVKPLTNKIIIFGRRIETIISI